MKRSPSLDDPLTGASDYEAAKDRALRWLAVRARSSRYITDRLLATGFTREVSTAVVSRLEELGLLNDELLANEVAERSLAKGRSGRAVSQDLRAAGLDAGSLGVSLGFDDAERALALARKRAPSLSGLSRETAVRRLSGHLARRGFSYEVVSTAVKSALEESGVIDPSGGRD